jgi:polysaccharide biosynthesis protein PslH
VDRQSRGAAARPGVRVKGEVLFLAHRVPYPPDRGDKIRSWNILKALAKLAPVHVAALVDPSDQVPEASPLHDLAASVTLLPRQRTKMGAMVAALANGSSASVELFANPDFAAAVKAILDQKSISHIYAFSGQMAQHIPNDRGDVRFIMDFVDMDSAKFLDFSEKGSFLSRLANRQEAKRLFAFELETAIRADASLFVSEAEAVLFRAKSGLGTDKITALENGVDLDHFAPRIVAPIARDLAKPMILFTGQMDYAPNVDAVCWFAKEVLPHIPNANFCIAGRAPTHEVLALAAYPQINVTGEVDDTRIYIEAADVVVAPLRIARGVQNKVLEAMAMGKPVVASKEAAEGIDAQPDHELLVANGAQDFAKAVSALIIDKAKARALGLAARQHMDRRYGWDAQMALLPAILSGEAVR